MSAGERPKATSRRRASKRPSAVSASCAGVLYYRHWLRGARSPAGERERERVCVRQGRDGGKRSGGERTREGTSEKAKEGKEESARERETQVRGPHTRKVHGERTRRRREGERERGGGGRERQRSANSWCAEVPPAGVTAESRRWPVRPWPEL